MVRRTAVPDKPKVLITGATGQIGRTLMEDLNDAYDLTGTSRSAQDDDRFVALEYDNLDDVVEAFSGQETVVHMHAKANHDTDAFDPYLVPNIIDVYKTYEAARLAKVRRVVFASSNHATGWYELVGDRCDAESVFRPDSFYGAAKVWGEALGRYYSDRFGLEVICLRIGSYQYRQKPPSWTSGIRILSTWLSDRDLVQLVRRSIDTPNIRFGIYYGISNNARGYWDLTNAQSELGYTPQDNAEEYAAEVLASGGGYDLWGFKAPPDPTVSGG